MLTETQAQIPIWTVAALSAKPAHVLLSKIQGSIMLSSSTLLTAKYFTAPLT